MRPERAFVLWGSILTRSLDEAFAFHYLNVMADPMREWKIEDDPDH